MIVEPATALRLAGTPRQRGRAQASARPGLATAVQAEARRRTADIERARGSIGLQRFLAEQFEFARAHCTAELEELDGIAEGFELDPRALFDGLHASALARLGRAEGCTAWAVGGSAPLLGKNRDIRADLHALQDVMLHEDPSHPMRAVLCVGSLGAPGAYSSGINRAGLAVADTAIYADHIAPGWLRYFAMTRLLWDCATVAEALDFLTSVRHTGGGSLVLADAGGEIAAVEFPATHADVERTTPVTRTNHFASPARANAALPDDAIASNSAGRLAHLRAALAAGARAPSLKEAATLMGSHAEDGALCRHADGEATRTVSSALFLPAARELLFAPDYPCLGRWRRYSLAAYDR